MTITSYNDVTIDNSKNTMEGVLAELARLGGRFSREDDIVFEGRQYRLPENQSFKASVKFLNDRLRNEEEEYSFGRTFTYLPWDGAVAVGVAMRELFGALVGKKIKTPFGDIPPSFMDVQVDVGKFEQAPWGQVALPWDPEGFLDVGSTRNDHGDIVFALSVQTRRKYRDEVTGLFNYIESVLHDRSIYRGKAITASEKPEFIDVSKVDPNDVVYTEDVMEALGVHVWLNVRQPQALRDNNQSLKRLVVVHGPYGTGKTLSAYLTGRECVLQSQDLLAQATEARKSQNYAVSVALLKDVTTFIIVRPGIDSWERALTIARCYGKCIIFVEDVDTLMRLHDDTQIRNMLEQTDGLTSKGAELQVIWTTNHLDRIPKGMLRPGRTDALIEVAYMDRPGVERLTKRVVKSLSPDVDFDAVFVAMEGYTPAYVREALDRTVRYNLFHNDGKLTEIATEDLVWAANGLRPQLAVMDEARESAQLPELENIFDSLIQQAVNTYTDGVVEHRLDGAKLISESSGDIKFRLATN